MSARLNFSGRGAAAGLLAFLLSSTAALAADLNALIWCDHADPALLQPFEEANGIKVNFKEFEGTGAGLALVEQSQPGDWDVLVIDGVDVLGPAPADEGLERAIVRFDYGAGPAVARELRAEMIRVATERRRPVAGRPVRRPPVLRVRLDDPEVP